MTPEYDAQTGKLRLLKYDSDGNGKVDTVSYMDGSRVVRIEIDKDEDGKVDRWEYYGARPEAREGRHLPRRRREGRRLVLRGCRTVPSTRLEISTQRDGKVTRIEHYQQTKLVAAEEDADGDGKIDKWETYDGERLSSVAFDTQHRGVPDRRLIYAPDGNARVEVDVKGDGHFVLASGAAAAPPK